MSMSMTTALRVELERALRAILAYEEAPGDPYHSRTHAAARRATLDLSRALAAWRKTQTHTAYDPIIRRPK